MARVAVRYGRLLVGRPNNEGGWARTKKGISNFQYFQIVLIFKWAKRCLRLLKKIETKYGYDGFKERNNFLHRNFFIFRIDFELKIWEVKVYILI
jgi:DNA modification methylase